MEAGAETCTLDATTIVASFGDQELLMNTSPTRCRALAEKLREPGIKPEWEVFSPTHIVQDVTTLLEAGLDEPPHNVNLVMGAHRGFQNAMPFSPRIVQTMVDLLADGCIFGAGGIGPTQPPVAMTSLLLGGHVRTGLEDNLYHRQGEHATNVGLVVRLVREMGFEPATPDEAREILGLPLKNAPVQPDFAIH